MTRAEIVAIARSWIGTPYHHQASLKGVGADCLGLIRGIWREVYAQEPELIGPYTPSWSEATGIERMLEGARRHLTEQPMGSMSAGDVLIFRIRQGAVAKHAGLLTDGRHMVHAQEGVPVSEVALGAWWRRRIAGVFRFPGVVERDQSIQKLAAENPIESMIGVSSIRVGAPPMGT
jgi:NlpC/P60 family putative phage cell wall peptidase